MIWSFQNSTPKFINDEWWQQKQTNLQNDINRTFHILIGPFQKQANELNPENWLEVQKPKLNKTIIQNSNEKEKEKTGAGY